MKKRTIIIIIVSAVALALVTYGVVSARQRTLSSSSDLQTQQVVYGDLSAVVDETGEVHPDQNANLYWESSGVVGEVLVSLGDEVRQDQVLAELDEDSLPQSYYLSMQEMISATRALEDLYENAATTAAAAQAAVAQAMDELDDAEHQWYINQPGNRYTTSSLKDAKADVKIAEKRLSEARNRLNSADGTNAKALAQSALYDAERAYYQAVWLVNWLQSDPTDIERAKIDADLAVATAKLEAAEREYERVKDGPDPEDIALAEARVAAAQAALDTARITAPFAGEITAVEVLPGDLVSPSMMAFRIDHLDTLLVDVNVSEVDIGQINVGQPVILEFDAILDKQYQGEVSEVSPVGTQIQGLVTFKVTIQIMDADDDVKPGLTAAVQIVVSQVEDVLLIPNRAVRWVNGEQVVYVPSDPDFIDERNLERIPVVLGPASDEYAQLLEGDLEEGDLIILNPPSVSIFEESEPGDGPPQAFR